MIQLSKVCESDCERMESKSISPEWGGMLYQINFGIAYVELIELSKFFTIKTPALRAPEEKLHELVNQRRGEKGGNDAKAIRNSN